MHSASSIQSLMRRPETTIRRTVGERDHSEKVMSGNRPPREPDFHKSCSSLFDKEGKGKVSTDRKLGESLTSFNSSFASLGSNTSANENESDMERKRRKQERQRERALQAEADRWAIVKSSLKPVPTKDGPVKCSSKDASTTTAPSITRRSSIQRPPLVERDSLPVVVAVPKSPKKAVSAVSAPKSPKKALTATPKSPKTPKSPRQPIQRPPLAPSPAYSSRHVQAASRMAALARGKRARRMAHYLRLQAKLASMERDTARDIQRIQKQTVADQKEFKSRATERFRKNLARKGDGDVLIQEAHDVVTKIRQENAELRELNQRLYTDIGKLRINNERLEESNETSTACMDRLVSHDDVCGAEHAKLKRVHATYEAAVAEHQKHLQLHVAYGDVEHKMMLLYRSLLSKVLCRVENCDNHDMVDEIYAAVEALENEWGSVPREMSKGKKEKKKKEKKKKEKKKEQR